MIFFGTKASRVKNGQLNNISCPNCENTTSFNYSIFQQYFHLYWIPAFPTGKENVLECNNCKKTFYLHQLPKAVKEKFAFEKQGVGMHIKFFSAPIAFVLLLSIIFYMDSKDDELDKAYMENPKKGDVYSHYSQENYGYYTTMKIAEVTEDTLYVFLNEYETNKKTDVDNIDKLENYTIEQYLISRAEIDSMYANGKIFEVDREDTE